MLRIAVCSAVLLAVVASLKWGLRWPFDNLGFGWGLMACAAVSAFFIIIAYLYDRANTRSQEVLPPEPRDFR